MAVFLTADNVVPVMNHSPFQEPIQWTENENETWAILGENGSGKTLLAEVISGKYNLKQGKILYPFFEKIKKESPKDEYPYLKKYIKMVSFNSVFSVSDFKNVYYQQRFNNTENNITPYVSDYFSMDENSNSAKFSKLFDFERIKNRRLIQLSSGELRKLLILKTLEENPRMIIFDNPFIGLDEASRRQLDDFFLQLSKENVQLLFLIPSLEDLPSAATHILEIKEGKIHSIEKDKNSKTVSKDSELENSSASFDWERLSLTQTDESDFETTVKMSNLDIIYDNRIIAQNIDWEIKKGEKWALSGPNGSGKSTLLSYIFADNPQAYSKNLLLFDRKRGTGESIWDIKKRIGFTSSEMHLYYQENVESLKVVESGFFDSIGLFRKSTSEQSEIAQYVMRFLGISLLENRSFLTLSSGEQRLVLFARSIVKNPDLLILDEPFHGLDDKNKQRCLQLIDSYCNQPNKSLIFVTHRKEEIPKNITHFKIL